MDRQTQEMIGNLGSEDKDVKYQVFLYVQAATNKPVDWAYEIWERLKNDLTHSDNHRRAIAGQLLCNLAKSDHEGRIFLDFPDLLELTKDKRFVTARHTLQTLWKIGLAGERQKEMLLNGLTERFDDCKNEKNCTLIRFDIIESLRKLYDQDKDETIRQKALTLIETEANFKYRRKYAFVWKK